MVGKGKVIRMVEKGGSAKDGGKRGRVKGGEKWG